MTESKTELMRKGFTPVDEGLPPYGRTVLVVTQNLRCIGFLDASMNWRYLKDHGLIHSVVAWANLNLISGRH
jgi:hypothetical protein